MQNITFNLNGKDTTVAVEPQETLLRLLREKLLLTGTKMGCEESECGACTVLIDGRPVNSCTVPAAKVNGKKVVTIEGLDYDEDLSFVQQSFVEAGAVQCGFCIPGVILSAKALLDKYDHPTDEQIRSELSGHLCRCTGYLQFSDAIHTAAAKIQELRDKKK
ncbi:MAG: (2Fe-2S)-binding protein [Oscillospiraceae bacterium]|nr:(2Fe-2S)-binding protein [Oscillospiraceae bacterium]